MSNLILASNLLYGSNILFYARVVITQGLSIRMQLAHNTKEMIAKAIPMTNYTSMASFPFPASVLSIVSITMELVGETRQFAHAYSREILIVS